MYGGEEEQEEEEEEEQQEEAGKESHPICHSTKDCHLMRKGLCALLIAPGLLGVQERKE